MLLRWAFEARPAARIVLILWLIPQSGNEERIADNRSLAQEGSHPVIPLQNTLFVERLWRSVKWEEVYLHDYQTIADALRGLDHWFRVYNHERPHQALRYQTPAQAFRRGW